MRIALLCLTLVTSKAFAQNPENYSSAEALDITTKALLQEPSVKMLVKHSEDVAWQQVDYIGLNRDYVRTFATIISPIFVGKLSTNGVQMGWEPKRGVKIRPDLNYYYKKGDYSTNLSINWGF